jgi:hypothetical protein
MIKKKIILKLPIKNNKIMSIVLDGSHHWGDLVRMRNRLFGLVFSLRCGHAHSGVNAARTNRLHRPAIGLTLPN